MSTLATPVKARSQKAIPTAAEPAAPTTFHELSVRTLHVVQPVLRQAASLMEATAEDLNSDLVNGLLKLVRTLTPQLAALLKRADMGDAYDGALTELSCDLIEVIEVLRAVNDPLDEPGIFGVMSLLEAAKGNVNGVIDHG